ncbi:hypothetical protein B0A52_07063 [Exophiala mesophila]|uniref:Uncharacterized protein n=1 Tax=Exophiala mesophila TaxID=212818 RepID=A0A438MY19_EXOME|nr:hypothetical protein B0A52_07063 [Exophiala mesophila]
MAALDSKQFKQDLVVSIRYRNDLPPPPMPPKLLDVDTGGLSHYLTPGYASGLAKREDPNIEVDAEGGMPIDMIGVPGYFLGDESAIMAPDVTPVLDPADLALLLTLDQIKSQGAHDNVSFLRKTQYMTASQLSATTNPFVSSTPAKPKPTLKSAPPPPVAKDDKENIKRHIQKGFDIAYPESIPYNPPEAKANPITQQERDAWKNPVHPDNPRLKPVGFYPLLPDVEAYTDVGGSWYAVKFDKAPLGTYRGRKDDRLDAALLGASENKAKHAEWLAKKNAYESNPELYEEPGPEPYVWTLYTPKQHDVSGRIQRIFDDSNPNKDDSDLIARLLEESADDTLRLPFERSRIYQNVVQTTMGQTEAMALSIIEPDNLPEYSRFREQGPAAYYYPIIERVRLKADRGNLGKTPAQAQAQAHEEELVDQVMISFRDARDDEQYRRTRFRAQFDPAFAAEAYQLEQANEAYEEALRADELLAQQAELQASAQDVTMQEATDEDHARISTNGVSRRDEDDEEEEEEDDDDNGGARVNGRSRREVVDDDDDDDDDEEMRDD